MKTEFEFEHQEEEYVYYIETTIEYIERYTASDVSGEVVVDYNQKVELLKIYDIDKTGNCPEITLEDIAKRHSKTTEELKVMFAKKAVEQSDEYVATISEQLFERRYYGEA